MTVTDFNGNKILLENSNPIIKKNPDYHNTLVLCLDSSVDDNQEQRLKKLNKLNKLNKLKKCKIM